MATDTAAMQSLAEISRKLNERSDTLNKIIASIESKLEAMNEPVYQTLQLTVTGGVPTRYLA
jgi:ABC-type transporter Mla subunit MlaD